VAEPDINGRQIKNVVRAAYSMAKSEGVVLNYQHISRALELMRNFEVEFGRRQAKALGDGDGRSRKRRQMEDIEESPLDV
jgi:hypothetical protein